MRHVISLLVVALCSLIVNAQDLDGYKYLYLKSSREGSGIEQEIENCFVNKGFTFIKQKSSMPTKREERMATLICSWSYEVRHSVGTFVTIVINNMLGENVMTLSGHANWGFKADNELARAGKNALKIVLKCPYQFDPDKTPISQIPSSSISAWTAEQINEYLSTKELDEIEGIYKNIGSTFYKLGIIKEGNKYVAIILETDNPNWASADVKAVFEEVRKGYYSVAYYNDDCKKVEAIAELDEKGILKITDYNYMKIFPIKK